MLRSWIYWGHCTFSVTTDGWLFFFYFKHCPVYLVVHDIIHTVQLKIAIWPQLRWQKAPIPELSRCNLCVRPDAGFTVWSLSPPDLSLQREQYVTVSVITLWIGCQREEAAERSNVAFGTCWRLKHNVCSITTELQFHAYHDELFRMRLHCVPLYMSSYHIHPSNSVLSILLSIQTQEFVAEQACNDITFLCWELVIAVKLTY